MFDDVTNTLTTLTLAVISLAILSVIIAPKSQTAQTITQAFQAFNYILGQAFSGIATPAAGIVSTPPAAVSRGWIGGRLGF